MFSDFRKYCKSNILMTRKHKKHSKIDIKTSKFIASHMEPSALAENRISTGTDLNVMDML